MRYRIALLGSLFVAAPANAILALPGNLGFEAAPARIQTLRKLAERCQAREMLFSIRSRTRAELWFDTHPQRERKTYLCIKRAAQVLRLPVIENTYGVREI